MSLEGKYVETALPLSVNPVELPSVVVGVVATKYGVVVGALDGTTKSPSLPPVDADVAPNGSQ
ncbi:MAG TPA: hypothetical protein VNR70_02175 [Steroidobacteraceae bacterium]|jgi:hypothetical protein|nr:hypothetical protein [Steroidobacteraceae bacterium]